LKLIVGALAALQALSHPHDEFGGLRVVCVACSSGIGRATADLLLQGGARVIISSRSPNKASDLVKKFPSTAHLIAADASDPAQLTRLAEEAKTYFGKPVTSLVWAPTAVAFGALRLVGAQAAVAAMQEQMNVNVYGLTRLVDAFKDDLLAVAETSPGFASVVAVSSVAGLNALHGILPYSMGKAAQDAAMRNLALEFGARGVRFNSVLPAVIETPIFDNMPPEVSAKLLKDAEHRHVLGRNGQPEEVGHVIAFLISKKASFITGQAIQVDGGASLLNSHADWYSELVTEPNDDRNFGLSRKWTLAKHQKIKEL